MLLVGTLTQYYLCLLAGRLVANFVTFPLGRIESLLATHLFSNDPRRDSIFRPSFKDKKLYSTTSGMNRVLHSLREDFFGFWRGFEFRMIEIIVGGLSSFIVGEFLIKSVNQMLDFHNLFWAKVPTLSTVISQVARFMMRLCTPFAIWETNLLRTHLIGRAVAHLLVPLAFPEELWMPIDQVEERFSSMLGGWTILKTWVLEWHQANSLVKSHIKSWARSLILGVQPETVMIPEDYGEELSIEEKIELTRRLRIWTTCQHLSPHVKELYDQELICDWEFGMYLPFLDLPYNEYPDLTPSTDRPWEESIYLPSFDVRPRDIVAKFVHEESYGDFFKVGIRCFPFDYNRWFTFITFQLAKSFILYPFSFLKNQLQTHSAFRSPKGALYGYWKNSIQCVENIYHEQGFFAFWRGIPVSLVIQTIRGIVSTLMANCPSFPTKEDQINVIMVPDPPSSNWIMANVASYAITFPLEVVRKRMTQKDSADRSIWAVLRSMWSFTPYKWDMFLPSKEILYALMFGLARVYLTGHLEILFSNFFHSQLSRMLLEVASLSHRAPPTSYISFGVSPLVPPYLWSSSFGGFKFLLNQFIEAKSLWYYDGESPFLL